MANTDSPLTEEREVFGAETPPFFNDTPMVIKEKLSKDEIINALRNPYWTLEIPDCVYNNFLKVSFIEDAEEFPDDIEDLEDITEELMGATETPKML